MCGGPDGQAGEACPGKGLSHRRTPLLSAPLALCAGLQRAWPEQQRVNCTAQSRREVKQ